MARRGFGKGPKVTFGMMRKGAPKGFKGKFKPITQREFAKGAPPGAKGPAAKGGVGGSDS